MPGYFITLEGTDGCGKSTQAKLLFDNLENLGYKVCLTREPGGSPAAEEIRSIFLKDNSMDAITETFLMSAARRDHWFKTIKPKLDDGCIVISDRFYDSTIVYQGLKEPSYIEIIKRIVDISVPGVHPNLTLFFNVPTYIISERLNKRKNFNAQDRVDEQHIDAMSEEYLKIANSVPYRACVINDTGIKNPEDITNDVVLPIVLYKLREAGITNGN